MFLLEFYSRAGIWNIPKSGRSNYKEGSLIYIVRVSLTSLFWFDIKTKQLLFKKRLEKSK
jgi:hypothetical protein